MKGWLLFLGHFFIYECLGSYTGVLRGGTAITGEVKVFHIAPDGKREEAVSDDESHLKEVLCAKPLVSKLHPCADHDTENVSDPYSGPPLYPMVAAYREAVQAGFACPLPAPFMHVVEGQCCVGRNPNIWPNICPTSTNIGSDSSPTTWNLKAEVNVHDHVDELPGSPGTPLFPPLLYKIGRPDVPDKYSKWNPTYLQILIYVALYMMVGALLGYVYNKLEEETAVVRGQKREEMFFKSGSKKKVEEKGFLSSGSSSAGDSESDLPDHSITMDHIYPVVVSPPLEEVENVSAAFGLLPGLPRGRSVMTGPATNES